MTDESSPLTPGNAARSVFAADNDFAHMSNCNFQMGQLINQHWCWGECTNINA